MGATPGRWRRRPYHSPDTMCPQGRRRGRTRDTFALRTADRAGGVVLANGSAAAGAQWLSALVALRCVRLNGRLAAGASGGRRLTAPHARVLPRQQHECAASAYETVAPGARPGFGDESGEAGWAHGPRDEVPVRVAALLACRFPAAMFQRLPAVRAQPSRVVGLRSSAGTVPGEDNPTVGAHLGSR